MATRTKVKTLTIDGKQIGARGDATILDVARENDIYIPTLCYLEGLRPNGGCRMCIVEIEGSDRLYQACVTQVYEGMEVTTTSERIQKYRKKNLQLIFSERNHVCSVCVSNGHCDLQYTAQRLGMEHVDYPYIYPNAKVDATHERFAVDHNRCIMCTRCVRVCEQVEGAYTWDIGNRGINARVVTDLNENWGDSDTCTSCGKCVQVCPTGALFIKGKSVAEMKKEREFLPYLSVMRTEETQ